jgi:hypothetical protein
MLAQQPYSRQVFVINCLQLERHRCLMVVPKPKILRQVPPSHTFRGEHIIATFTKHSLIQVDELNGSAGYLRITFESGAGTRSAI